MPAVSTVAAQSEAKEQSSQRQRIVPTGSKINFKLSASRQIAPQEAPAAVSNGKPTAGAQHDKMAELAKSCLQEPGRPPLSSRHTSSKAEQDRVRKPLDAQPDTPVYDSRRARDTSSGTPSDQRRSPKRSRLSRKLAAGNLSEQPASREPSRLKQSGGTVRLFENLSEPRQADNPTSGGISPQAAPQPSSTPSKQDNTVIQSEALPKQPAAVASASPQKPQKKKITAREALERLKAKIAQLEEARLRSDQERAVLQAELDQQKALMSTAQPKLVCLLLLDLSHVHSTERVSKLLTLLLKAKLCSYKAPGCEVTSFNTRTQTN